jgi:Nuclease-related domain.
LFNGNRLSRFGLSDEYPQTILKVIFDKGAYGEYLVYKILKSISPPRYFLFDVYLPKDNGETTGMTRCSFTKVAYMLFKSKITAARFLERNQWAQTLNNKGKTIKNHFLNPIMQNELHIKWLENLLSKYPNLIFHSYVLFGDRYTLKNITLTSEKAKVMNRIMSL